MLVFWQYFTVKYAYLNVLLLVYFYTLTSVCFLIISQYITLVAIKVYIKLGWFKHLYWKISNLFVFIFSSYNIRNTYRFITSVKIHVLKILFEWTIFKNSSNFFLNRCFRILEYSKRRSINQSIEHRIHIFQKPKMYLLNNSFLINATKSIRLVYTYL